MGDSSGSDVELARLQLQHRERLKELAALHDIAKLLNNTALSFEDLLTRVASRLPSAMQYVDGTSARVACGDLEATTPGFATTPWSLQRAFETSDGRAGVVEIVYGNEHPHESEGPFLLEERTLIDSIADMLRGELDRRNAALNVRDRDAQLTLAAAAADLAVWEWAIDEDRVTWSPEMVRMLGRDGTGAGLGVTRDAIHEDDRQRVLQTVQDAVADPDRTFDLEFRASRADGGVFWIGARGRAVPETEHRPARVLGVLSDITRRKMLEQSLLQLQKMEAMGRVAAGVAHDFNNLLAVITINNSELLDSFALDDPCRELAREVEAVLKRGSALTSQLLAFSRKSEIKPIVVDPVVAIQNAEPMLKRLVGRQARLVLELNPTRQVLVDASQLDQLIMNLVVNARDATPNGGTITVATRAENVDRERVRKTTGPHAVISVADTGSGMTAEVKARLFEPFFTTKPAGKGTGLGLAVVFGVVEQSNGFVTVDSEPDRGARFDVFLPAVA